MSVINNRQGPDRSIETATSRAKIWARLASARAACAAAACSKMLSSPGPSLLYVKGKVFTWQWKPRYFKLGTANPSALCMLGYRTQEDAERHDIEQYEDRYFVTQQPSSDNFNSKKWVHITIRFVVGTVPSKSI